MRVEDLERELRAERPGVEPEFARKLDEWAAAGFPRGGELERRARGRVPGGLGRVPVAVRRRWERLRAVPPRRLIAPIGAAATLIVVVAIGVSQVNLPEDGDDEGGVTAVEEAPTGAPEAAPGGGAKPADAAAGAGASSAELGERERALALPPEGALLDRAGGGVARGEENRLQDVSALLSLGAEADEVQDVANGVIEVTDRYDGIVLNSQVTSDQAGARAAFQLEIPFTKLDPALTDLSELGDVISRTEAAEDITQRFVRARNQLADTLNRVSKLRIELIDADTFEQRRIIRAQIASLKATADALDAEVNQVERQARFASVAVDLTSNGPASGDGGWDLDDALEDAGEVLTTLGGVALIALAVIVPIALAAALAYWAVIAARRRARERTLRDN